jgi:hypothetical protein
MAEHKRPSIYVWITPLLLGFVGFGRVAQSPSFAMYRAVDIVQLIACGVCFGAAMVGVIFTIRGRRP